MAAIVEKKARKIIPRWRNFVTTVALGELDHARPSGARSIPAEDFLSEKLTAWNASKTLWHASDLIGAAVVLGRESEVHEAAKFVVSQGRKALPSAHAIAGKILDPGGWQHSELARLIENQPENAQQSIRRLRAFVREGPRNPVAWVDLALAYTILGAREKAERAMGVALALAPDDRFVLRSAARFFVHGRNLDEALRILRASETTPHDPWLLAAEIAIASAQEKPSRFAKVGKGVLSDENLNPSQTSELASALATLELENGKQGPSRKLFRHALLSPNENTIAQAEWASRHLSRFDFRAHSYAVPRLFEAKAWECFSQEEWVSSLENSQKWLDDQPFSSRPAMLGSYLAACIFEDYEVSERMILKALKANPIDPMLLNNLAFTYGSWGRTADAEGVLDRIDKTNLKGPSLVTVMATGGLIDFRKGLLDRGRKAYMEAMDVAKKAGLEDYRVRALVYLAREEIIARTEFSSEALSRAETESEPVSTAPDVRPILKHIKKLSRTLPPER